MKPLVKRTFQPLEEWVYLKVYVNPISSNLVLIRYIIPIIKELYPAISPKWFFLRYKDTHYHLRVRFWIPSISEIGRTIRIISLYLKEAMQDGYVHRWSIDGYEREIERYGLENMIKTEDCFCISSSFLTNVISEVCHNDYLINCLALSMIHVMMINFLPELEDRLRLCENNMRSLSSEFHLSQHHIRLINEKYRKYRNFTDSLTTGKEVKLFNEKTDKLFKDYSIKLSTLLGEMTEEVRLSMNLRSIIHLDINRVYEIDARKIEMVLYHLLYKAYIAEKYRMGLIS